MSIFSDIEKENLRALAFKSIEFGLKQHKKMPINLQDYPLKLHEFIASFVTLNINKKLRGCIGSLVASKPLVIDIVHNAYMAAFQDSRFLPLEITEFELITVDVSILSKPEEIYFSSEENLISLLRPGIDGLILTTAHLQGTFLPSVWSNFPCPKDFLQNLKIKTGLSQDYWGDDIKIYRYQVE